ncbi:FG-GAP repeat domain-containing protein [Streptomyces phaeofaciens]|uniref:FG-GAP repeat domain-containing protein n=1 Tax=Streptomyces phaeofaciens TaxID=68254 RepID=UPI0036A8D0AD
MRSRGGGIPPHGRSAAHGREFPDGSYTWTLTAAPADGQGVALSHSGTVRLTGDTAVRRDHVGGSYDAVVGVGDITADGKADLVARDTAGDLYRQNGTGKGTFGSRPKIASGWAGYQGVFQRAVTAMPSEPVTSAV